MNLLKTRFQDAKGHCLYFPYEGDKKHLFCNLNALWECKELDKELKKDVEQALYYFYFVEVLPIMDYAELVARNKYKAHWCLWVNSEEKHGK